VLAVLRLEVGPGVLPEKIAEADRGEKVHSRR
jgi:hypothetical protein